MAIIVHRHDDFAIAAPYLVPRDRAASLVNDMKTPAYMWRRWLRRLYVLTWPISMLTRFAMFVVLIVTWLTLGIAGYIGARLAYIWHGERSPWE